MTMIPSIPEIAFRHVSKCYGDRQAISDVSFTVNGGKIVCILGRNGAGKSTILKLICGLAVATSGTIVVAGFSLPRDRLAALSELGVALQSVGLDPLMTVKEHFTVQGALARLQRSVVLGRACQLMDDFGMADRLDSAAGQLSGGMQRRLCLALALLQDPRIILFDEPTVGLDPQSRAALWNVIRRYVDRERTVVFSTQYLEEAERHADEVIIITHGRVTAVGTVAELRSVTAQRVIKITSSDGSTITGEAGGSSVDADREGNIIIRPDRTGTLRERIRSLAGDISEISLSPPSLEDVFVTMSGEQWSSDDEGTGVDITLNTHGRGASRR
jgi:ABC-2 type transport system ATP-binding protein